MPRVVGVDIPNQKAIWIALTYVYGIGRHTAEEILKEAEIDKDAKAGKLTEDELSRITQIIDRPSARYNLLQGCSPQKGTACSWSADA
jgi:small subunit ribosomal protein S13